MKRTCIAAIFFQPTSNRYAPMDGHTSIRLFMGAAWFVWVLAISGMPQVVQAQYRAEARLDTASIRVGDRVRLHLKVEGPSGMLVHRIGLDTLRSVQGIERVSSGEQITEPVAGTSREVLIQEVQLTAFDTGRFQIPPIPIEVSSRGQRAQLESNDLVLEVRSVLTDSTTFAPIKNIIREPLKVRDFWIIGVLLLVGIVGYIFYRYRRRPRPEVNPEVVESKPRPASAIALEKLTALEAADYPAKGEFKYYQSALTYILREFIFHQFGYNALEASSEEIQQQLAVLGIDESWVTQLSALLTRADLVKFAKGTLPLEMHYAALDSVRSLVQCYVPEDNT